MPRGIVIVLRERALGISEVICHVFALAVRVLHARSKHLL